MALSTKLLKRLNSEKDPLPKRIKLAEIAFSIVDLPIVKKDELLLEWLCKTCLTHQQAWKTLNEFLQSHIDIKTNGKQCLVDMLVQKLNTNMEDIKDEVLQCCNLVFSNNSMRQYFTNNPISLGIIMKALLNYLLKYSDTHSHCCNIAQKQREQLKSDKSKQKFTLANNYFLTSIIKSLAQIYKQSVTRRDELREIFMNDILHLLCNLIGKNYKSLVAVSAYEYIQQLLLNKSQFIDSKRMTDESRQVVVSTLFRVLSKNMETLCLESNLLTYTFIFYTVVHTCKSDQSVLLDTVFRGLIESSERYKFEILNACLRHLHDVTLDFDNVIGGVTLNEYLQKIVTDILAHENLREALLYKIFTRLAYINPILIEKCTPDILKKILVRKQNADLLNALLHCSTKLRREQKFISQLLASLKETVKIKSCETGRTFFPDEFTDKLTSQFNNFSSSQIIATLRTIIHYLSTDCAKLLESNTSCEDTLMLKATVELLLIFFSSIQILEHIKLPLASEKLVNGLEELGNTLSLLIDKALCLSYNKDVIVLLLSSVQSLSDMQNMLKYYVPKDVATKQLSFPIQDDPWQQLIQRISNFGERNCKDTMNKLILHRVRLNISHDLSSPVKLTGLIGGLEHSWSIILDHYADLLSLVHDSEVHTVTYFLLTYITSNKKNYDSSHNILKREYLQENRQFVNCLLGHILAYLGQCTKSITDITPKLIFEKERNDKLIEILQVMKEQISQEHWIQMTKTIANKITYYLKVLLDLPIIYFSANVNLLVFLIVYSVSKECENNAEIQLLCNKIFSDLLEDARIDIFQYIEPSAFVNQLSQSKAFAKACKYHLRKATYVTLKSFIKSCVRNKKAMCTVLEYMETIKLKSTERKVIIRKAKKRLIKAILKELPEAIDETFDVKCLIAVVKTAIVTENVSDDLKKLTELTHNNIFTAEENLNNLDVTLVEQSAELAVIVLRNRKVFEVPDMTIKGLWRVMLRYPQTNLFEPLLASTKSKAFYEVLKLLHEETVTSVSQADERAWKNLFVIWSGVMKTDVNTKRNTMRLHAVNNLFEVVLSSDIPSKYWSHVLHLSCDIIAVKHLFIRDITIDLIIMTALKSLDRALYMQKIVACECVLVICKALIKMRLHVITDKLPNLLLLYRSVIKIVVHGSRYINDDRILERRFRCLAFDIEKFTSSLVKLKKDMIRLSPYIIADLLEIITERTPPVNFIVSEIDLAHMAEKTLPYPSYIKVALHNSLYQLISICDQHAIAFLSRALPVSLQEVFKVQLDTFNKFYKYSGKV